MGHRGRERAMYARSTTMTAGGSGLEAGIRYARDEVWPAVSAMEGCMGFSLMVQRDTGRMIATSSWESMEAMRSSDTKVEALRRGVAELMGAQPPQVQEWEIAVMHRDHHTGEGTCVRSTWTRVPTDAMDQAMDFYKYVVLPEVQELDGFCSACLMVDRSTGTGVSSVAFDSREAMEATRPRADEIRGRSSRDAGVEILESAEFELVLAHLHVPELV